MKFMKWTTPMKILSMSKVRRDHLHKWRNLPMVTRSVEVTLANNKRLSNQGELHRKVQLVAKLQTSTKVLIWTCKAVQIFLDIHFLKCLLRVNNLQHNNNNGHLLDFKQCNSQPSPKRTPLRIVSKINNGIKMRVHFLQLYLFQLFIRT